MKGFTSGMVFEFFLVRALRCMALAFGCLMLETRTVSVDLRLHKCY